MYVYLCLCLCVNIKIAKKNIKKTMCLFIIKYYANFNPFIFSIKTSSGQC